MNAAKIVASWKIYIAWLASVLHAASLVFAQAQAAGRGEGGEIRFGTSRIDTVQTRRHQSKKFIVSQSIVLKLRVKNIAAEANHGDRHELVR